MELGQHGQHVHRRPVFVLDAPFVRATFLVVAGDHSLKACPWQTANGNHGLGLLFRPPSSHPSLPHLHARRLVDLLVLERYVEAHPSFCARILTTSCPPHQVLTLERSLSGCSPSSPPSLDLSPPLVMEKSRSPLVGFIRSTSPGRSVSSTTSTICFQSISDQRLLLSRLHPRCDDLVGALYPLAAPWTRRGRRPRCLWDVHRAACWSRRRCC